MEESNRPVEASFAQRLSNFRYSAPVERRSSRLQHQLDEGQSGFKPVSSPKPSAGVTSNVPRGKRSAVGSRRPRRPPAAAGSAFQSRYAHLPELQDVLQEDLICAFVGLNPGIQTATKGHAYAHPSNLFWKLLHSSGCTDRRCRPEEDVHLPRLYSMGNTNIVARPTKDQSELSKAEMVAGTPVLDAKFRKYKPEAVCVVGKGIWEAMWRYRRGRPLTKAEFHYGWQAEEDSLGRPGPGEEELDCRGRPWRGARVFVAASTSGLSASLRPHEKEEIWREFGEWVRRRRQERLLESA